MFEHAFRVRNRRYRLVYALERIDGVKCLVLLDVLAASNESMLALPDWRVELEAMRAADNLGAKYT
jgi:hypothetical protein